MSVSHTFKSQIAEDSPIIIISRGGGFGSPASLSQRCCLPACPPAAARHHHPHRDPSTGTQLAQYKGNACPRGAVCRVGGDYFAAAQSAKDAVHFWVWHKVQIDREQGSQGAVAVAVALCVLFGGEGGEGRARGAECILY